MLLVARDEEEGRQSGSSSGDKDNVVMRVRNVNSRKLRMGLSRSKWSAMSEAEREELAQNQKEVNSGKSVSGEKFSDTLSYEGFKMRLSSEEWDSMNEDEREEHIQKQKEYKRRKGRRRRGEVREHCSICGYDFRHNTDECWELEQNASSRPKNWEPRLSSSQRAVVSSSMLTEKHCSDKVCSETPEQTSSICQENMNATNTCGNGTGSKDHVDCRAPRRVSTDATEFSLVAEDSSIVEKHTESILNESSEEEELITDSSTLEHISASKNDKRRVDVSEEARVKKKPKKTVSFAEETSSASIKNAEFKAAEKLASETKKKWAIASKNLKERVRKKEAAEKTVAEMKKLFADQEDVITPLEKLATETNAAAIAAQKDYAECKEKHTAAEKHVIGIRMLSAVDSKIKTLKSKRDELHELLKGNPHFQALQATMRELKDSQAERIAAVEVVEKCKNKL